MRKRMTIGAFIAALVSAALPAAALNVGDRAPVFTAESTEGRISLGDFTGKAHVVLAFYYADFTPV